MLERQEMRLWRKQGKTEPSRQQDTSALVPPKGAEVGENLEAQAGSDVRISR